jgi:hypothetical protein
LNKRVRLQRENSNKMRLVRFTFVLVNTRPGIAYQAARIPTAPTLRTSRKFTRFHRIEWRMRKGRRTKIFDFQDSGQKLRDLSRTLDRNSENFPELWTEAQHFSGTLGCNSEIFPKFWTETRRIFQSSGQELREFSITLNRNPEILQDTGQKLRDFSSRESSRTQKKKKKGECEGRLLHRIEVSIKLRPPHSRKDRNAGLLRLR